MKKSEIARVLLMMGSLAFGFGAMAGEKVSKKAVEPDVTLINQNAFKGQKPFTLKNYKDKVIVLEFWASWCPPCRESIPRLSATQEKYKGDAVFVGVSVEPKKETKKFYNSMKDNMKYRVAVDLKGTAHKNYMDAFGVSGIPHAFIIKDDNIIWHGHPMGSDMEETLEKAIADDDKKKSE